MDYELVSMRWTGLLMWVVERGVMLRLYVGL